MDTNLDMNSNFDMSPNLEQIIGRAFTVNAFREKLLSDPEGAIKSAGFSLTDSELALLKKEIKKLKDKGNDETFDDTFASTDALMW